MIKYTENTIRATTLLQYSNVSFLSTSVCLLRQLWNGRPLFVFNFGTFSGDLLKFQSFFQIVKFDPSVALTLEKNIQHIKFTFSIYHLLEYLNVKS